MNLKDLTLGKRNQDMKNLWFNYIELKPGMKYTIWVIKQ